MLVAEIPSIQTRSGIHSHPTEVSSQGNQTLESYYLHLQSAAQASRLVRRTFLEDALMSLTDATDKWDLPSACAIAARFIASYSRESSF